MLKTVEMLFGVCRIVLPLQSLRQTEFRGDLKRIQFCSVLECSDCLVVFACLRIDQAYEVLCVAVGRIQLSNFCEILDGCVRLVHGFFKESQVETNARSP